MLKQLLAVQNMRWVETTGKHVSEYLHRLFRKADEFRLTDHVKKSGLVRNRMRKVLKGQTMMTLFLEPSLRTRVSFEAAMHKLGGNVITACGAESTAISKGEDISDTIFNASLLTDLLVIRTAQSYGDWHTGGFKIPIINAGDGGNNHPTQALIDMYTIWRSQFVDHPLYTWPTNISIGIAGDVDKSRTIKSFVEIMSLCGSNRFVVYDAANDPEGKKPLWAQRGDITLVDQEEFALNIDSFDVLYMNRIQRERRFRGHGDDPVPFVLTEAHADSMKEDAIILNPGPRQEEMPPVLDYHPRNKMYEQVTNGLYLRMALLCEMLGRSVMCD